MLLAKKIISLVFALFILIMNAAETPAPENFYEPISTQSFALTDALFRGQGITTDGEHYYFSYNFGIMKTKLDAKTVVCQRAIAIPAKLLLKGCDHIGGISYANGYIYATTEDSKVFENLYMLKFDAETLECVDYKELPAQHHENGAPWCVADPEKNVVYSARRDHIEQINVYDAQTLAFKEVINLDAPVHKVQGGEMYNGILYLSVSRGSQSVFAVNLKTGEVLTAIERNLTEGSEGEGMTILPTADGALFHVLDIGSVRVGVHLRHYAFDTGSLKWAK